MQAYDPDQAHAWCKRLAGVYERPYGGVVAALAATDGQFFYSNGQVSRQEPHAPDQHALFEIGSITKVFTAILLAKLVVEQRIDPNAPVSSLIPELSGLPVWITPRSLALHAAGLPKVPFGLLLKGPTNPYADFMQADLIAWMARHRPKRAPKPDAFRYSNLGVGLLGYVLGRVAGQSFKPLLQQEVLSPLGLSDTHFELDAASRPRLAQPYAAWGRAVAPWDFDVLAGAGALRSSAHDLLMFGRAIITAKDGKGPLADAIRLTLQVQIPGKHSFIPGRCFGWTALTDRVTQVQVYNHDGATRGSSASFYVCPAAGFVLLALANTPTSLLTAYRQVKANISGLLHDIILSAQPESTDASA